MCAASHLWWSTEARGREGEDVKELYRDGKRVLECLQRALRVADACMDAAVSVELFVEILNQYVYYFDQENDAVCIFPLPPYRSKCVCVDGTDVLRSRRSTSTALLSLSIRMPRVLVAMRRMPARWTSRNDIFSGRWITSRAESMMVSLLKQGHRLPDGL